MLLLEGHSSTRDLADILGSTPGAVQTVRQTIRRKLAVPRNGDLAQFIDDLPGLRDLARERLAPGPRPALGERRQNLVLRAAVRELESAVARVRAKVGALTALAREASAEEHDAILAEAAVIDLIAQELEGVRSRAVEIARAGSSR